MVRKLAIVVGLGVVLAAGGVAMAAGSKCDSGVTKAAGKKVSCKDGVFAKGQAKGVAADTAKLAKCESKFAAACSKAKGAGDCSVQTGSCANKETAADNCANSLASSPSGAFLN